MSGRGVWGGGEEEEGVSFARRIGDVATVTCVVIDVFVCVSECDGVGSDDCWGGGGGGGDELLRLGVGREGIPVWRKKAFITFKYVKGSPCSGFATI